MNQSPPRHRWKHQEGRGSRSSRHGDNRDSYRKMLRSHGDAKHTRLRSEDKKTKSVMKVELVVLKEHHA